MTWQSVLFYAAVIFVASFAWAVTKKFYEVLHAIEIELREANEHLKSVRDYLERIDRKTPDPGFWIEIQKPAKGEDK